MSELLTFEGVIALLTLTGLEIVLGIDNVVVIAVIVGKLKKEVRDQARRLGLFLAMFIRILLLLLLSWLIGLTEPLFAVMGQAFSGRDLILLLGGLFLVAKATHEIHDSIEAEDEQTQSPKPKSFFAAIVQIILLDLVFSLDSVITAIGMTNHVSIMIVAIIIAVGVMMIFSGQISRFIEVHPTLKMLALSFILLIGVMLIADGFGRHIERGYIYFAMFFSLGVEVLNLVSHRKKTARKH